MGFYARHPCCFQNGALDVGIGHSHLLADVVDEFNGRFDLFLRGVNGVPVLDSSKALAVQLLVGVTLHKMNLPFSSLKNFLHTLHSML